MLRSLQRKPQTAVEDLVADEACQNQDHKAEAAADDKEAAAADLNVTSEQ